MKQCLDELGYWVIDQIKKDLVDNELLGFAWDIAYREKVSNSHNAPKKGVTNFFNEQMLPKGYPGFRGVVWYRTKNDHKLENPFIKFPSTMTHTGSGGGGAYGCDLWKDYYNWYYKSKCNDKSLYPHVYSYDYRFFLMDFPELEKVINDELVLCELKNKKFNNALHHFSWFDEETREKDLTLMSGQ